MGPKGVTDRLNAGGRDAFHLARELERVTDAGGVASKRDVRRWSLATEHRCVVTVHGEANATSNLAAVPRNLSKTGAGLLVAQFVYPGSRCVLSIRAQDGKGVGIRGVVARCGHVSGLLHEIGIHFDEPIDPAVFPIRAEDLGLPDRERVDPATLEGTVLFLEPEPANQRVVMHHLRSTSVDPIFARTGVEALELLDQAAVVFVDDLTPDLDGLAFVDVVKGMGSTRPLVVVLPAADHGRRDALLASGASAVLVRPVLESQILQTIATYLDGPVQDHCAERESHRDVLLGLCDDLAQAIESGEKSRVKRCMTTINGVANGFGFTAAAGVVQGFLTRLSAAEDLTDFDGAAQSLRQVCEREGHPRGRSDAGDPDQDEGGADAGDASADVEGADGAPAPEAEAA